MGLLVVVATTASVSDPAGARLLLARLGGAGKKLRRIWVDGTYRGSLMDWVPDHFRFVLQPVLRTDGKKGFLVLPRRWIVERTFVWLTQCRRLSKDDEVLPARSEAMTYLAMTRLMLHRLAPSPFSDSFSGRRRLFVLQLHHHALLPPPLGARCRRYRVMPRLGAPGRTIFDLARSRSPFQPGLPRSMMLREQNRSNCVEGG